MDKFYALDINEPVCYTCFYNIWNKLEALIGEKAGEEDFPPEITKESFLEDMSKQFPIENSYWSLGPGKNLLKTLRDRVLDLVEKKRRNESLYADTSLFPTRMELAQQYNRLLKKLLTAPGTNLPFFRVDKESPGEDFLAVSIPERLEWIFAPAQFDKSIKLWVNQRYSFTGMRFLQIISAICTGISNLIDMRELAKNPSFIISNKALYNSSLEEGTLSKIRRLSLQTIAPIFCTYDYNFSPEDLLYHALSAVELMKIGAADQWRKIGCANEDFREMLFVMSLMLDREKELDKAYFIMDKIFHFAPEDTRLSFHRARIRSLTGDFELALENIERALKLDPENEVLKKARYMVMEKMPISDPFNPPGCPDINGIFKYLTREMPNGESEIFRRHIDGCPQCSLWLELMGVIAGKGEKPDGDEKPEKTDNPDKGKKTEKCEKSDIVEKGMPL